MRKGKYEASAATLRMKMDMSSPNPNMWDQVRYDCSAQLPFSYNTYSCQVAYRIKYVPHPHIGDEWCVYPTYDYTHCIIDR
jgi:glutaminyl-tRNA synthetase